MDLNMNGIMDALGKIDIDKITGVVRALEGLKGGGVGTQKGGGESVHGGGVGVSESCAGATRCNGAGIKSEFGAQNKSDNRAENVGNAEKSSEQDGSFINSLMRTDGIKF